MEVYSATLPKSLPVRVYCAPLFPQRLIEI